MGGVNHLHIPTEQTGLGERRDLALALAAHHVAMDRDRDAEPARRVGFAAIDLGRARDAEGPYPAPAHAERQQSSVGMARPVAVQPFQTGEVDRLGRGQPSRVRERESAAQPGLGERPQIGIGMLGAADIVTPVMHEGDAAVERFGRGQARAVIHVARQERLAQGRGGGKIAARGLVAGHAAQQRVPHMPMGLDQAGQRDHVPAVDHHRIRRGEAAADRDDRAVAQQDVAVGEVAERRIHGHHIGFADQQVAALGSGRTAGWTGAAARPVEPPAASATRPASTARRRQ